MKTKLPVCLARAATVAALQLAVVVFVPGPARAQDAPKAEEPKKKTWESVASADATLTRGNSHSFLGTVSLNTQRKWERDEVLLGAGAGYGNNTVKESNGQEVTSETQDYLRGFGQYNHLFTERLYGGLRLEGLHDNMADINYRFTVSPMAGYYFIKETNTTLAAEIGPSLVTQELGHDRSTYMGLRIGQRFEHKFNTGARIWESLEWIPQVDNFDNWILNGEAGISAPIIKALDVRLVAQDNYNNQPASGRLKNDFRLLAGIGYRF